MTQCIRTIACFSPPLGHRATHAPSLLVANDSVCKATNLPKVKEPGSSKQGTLGWTDEVLTEVQSWRVELICETGLLLRLFPSAPRNRTCHQVFDQSLTRFQTTASDCSCQFPFQYDFNLFFSTVVLALCISRNIEELEEAYLLLEMPLVREVVNTPLSTSLGSLRTSSFYPTLYKSFKYLRQRSWASRYS